MPNNGYSRKALAEFVDGQPVVASPLNKEFDALQAAFSGTDGHAYDGTPEQGPKINLATSLEGFLPAEHGGVGGKNNLTATTAPLSTSDVDGGYAPGSIWFNLSTSRIFICTDNTAANAKWFELVAISYENNVIQPINDAAVSVGDTLFRFKDLWLSGRVTATEISGFTALGEIAMGDNKVSGVATPTANADAANKAYVDGRLDDLISAAPGALNTLLELANALGDDPDFAATMTNSLATKLNEAGGTMTGAIAMSNNKISGLPAPVNLDDAANKGYIDGLLPGITAEADRATTAASSI